MRITIFGLVWLSILIVVFVRNNKKIMLLMLMLGMLLQSVSVLIMNDIGVGPQLITSVAFIAYAIFYSNAIQYKKIVIKKWEVIKKTPIIFMVLLAIYIVVIVKKQDVIAVNKNVYLNIIQLFIYMGCFLSVWTISKKYNMETVNYVMLWVITAVAFVGVVQLLTTINILPRNIILETFLYSRDTDSAYYWGLFYPRIFSVFMEPSYCGAFLVGAFYYLIAQEKMTRFTLGLTIVLVVEIMLTFSSTAYGALCLTGIIYLLVSRNKKALKFLVPLGFVMILLLGVTGELQVILNQVIFDKANSGSGHTRKIFDQRALRAFQKSPLTGVGYKGVRGSQFYYSILGQIGIIGTVLFALIIILLVCSALKKRISISSALLLIGIIIAQMIAIPDLDFCVLWQGMYLVALTINLTEEGSYA